MKDDDSSSNSYLKTRVEKVDFCMRVSMAVTPFHRDKFRICKVIKMSTIERVIEKASLLVDAIRPLLD